MFDELCVIEFLLVPYKTGSHYTLIEISRCNLFTSLPSTLSIHVKDEFTWLLDQVCQYIAGGLELASDVLTRATNLRAGFVKSVLEAGMFCYRLVKIFLSRDVEALT